MYIPRIILILIIVLTLQNVRAQEPNTVIGLNGIWEFETEWIRSEPELAGVIAFCYLANNYGYTGDWFMDKIKDLKPIPTLNWFRHAFAPTPVFINYTDERYVKLTDPHQPGEKLSFKLAKINDQDY